MPDLQLFRNTFDGQVWHGNLLVVPLCNQNGAMSRNDELLLLVCITTLFYMPINFGKVIKRLMKKIEAVSVEAIPTMAPSRTLWRRMKGWIPKMRTRKQPAGKKYSATVFSCLSPFILKSRPAALRISWLSVRVMDSAPP